MASYVYYSRSPGYYRIDYIKNSLSQIVRGFNNAFFPVIEIIVPYSIRGIPISYLFNHSGLLVKVLNQSKNPVLVDLKYLVVSFVSNRSSSL